MTQSPFQISRDWIARVLARTFPADSIENYETLSGGLINTNLKVNLVRAPPVVVRIYRDGADVCRKEFAIYELLKGVVPVANILDSQSDGLDGSPAFAVFEFIEGITFQNLKRTEEVTAIQQASYSAGKTLATFGKISFSKPGRLLVHSSSLSVGEPFISTPNAIPNILDQFLSSKLCEHRLGSAMATQLHNLMWSRANELSDLDEESHLVHSDFGGRNILVREEFGGWVVAAVLDWEFSFSGPRLVDVGHFLRYELGTTQLREPYFSRGFREHGGTLPENWRELARLIDLTGLVEILTHTELPGDIQSEILELIVATLNNSDRMPHRFNSA